MLSTEIISSQSDTLSERQALDYAATRERGLDLALSVMSDGGQILKSRKGWRGEQGWCSTS